MPCSASADDLVMGGGFIAAGVPGHGVAHSFERVENRFNAPETASRDHCHFGFLVRFRGVDSRVGQTGSAERNASKKNRETETPHRDYSRAISLYSSQAMGSSRLSNRRVRIFSSSREEDE